MNRGQSFYFKANELIINRFNKAAADNGFKKSKFVRHTMYYIFKFDICPFLYKHEDLKAITLYLTRQDYAMADMTARLRNKSRSQVLRDALYYAAIHGTIYKTTTNIDDKIVNSITQLIPALKITEDELVDLYYTAKTSSQKPTRWDGDNISLYVFKGHIITEDLVLQDGTYRLAAQCDLVPDLHFSCSDVYINALEVLEKA